MPDEILIQEIISLKERLKIAIEIIKTHDPKFDGQLFLHQSQSVDLEQLMEEMVIDNISHHC